MHAELLQRDDVAGGYVFRFEHLAAHTSAGRPRHIIRESCHNTERHG